MTRTTHWLAVVAAGVCLTLSACAGVDDRGGGDEAGSDSAGGDATSDTALATEGEGAEAAPDAAVTSVDLVAAAEGRRVISTATVRLRVDDLDAAVTTASDLVTDLGGLVYAEHTDLRQEAHTQLTLKVPPEHFRDLLTGLAGLGEVETQTVETDDVTEQVVDLESRISTAEVSVERLRGLLDQATTVRDITTIERELLQRETSLETLRGELRTIERQVALATVTVTLRAQRLVPPPPAEEGQAGFFEGLHGGGHALKVAAIAGSAVAGALLPWLPLIAAGLLVSRRWWWRRPAARS
jgi:Domain of unknown function (DUF4349)